MKKVMIAAAALLMAGTTMAQLKLQENHLKLELTIAYCFYF